MDDQTSSSIASEIVMHLKLSNWRFTKGAAHALALKDRA
jgi:hypothetical protein